MSDEAEKITRKDLQEAVAKEMALFLEENRPVIIERALAKLRELRKDADEKVP